MLSKSLIWCIISAYYIWECTIMKKSDIELIDQIYKKSGLEFKKEWENIENEQLISLILESSNLLAIHNTHKPLSDMAFEDSDDVYCGIEEKNFKGIVIRSVEIPNSINILVYDLLSAAVIEERYIAFAKCIYSFGRVYMNLITSFKNEEEKCVYMRLCYLFSINGKQAVSLKSIENCFMESGTKLCLFVNRKNKTCCNREDASLCGIWDKVNTENVLNILENKYKVVKRTDEKFIPIAWCL